MAPSRAEASAEAAEGAMQDIAIAKANESKPFVLPSTWRKVNARLYVSPDRLRYFDSLEEVEQHLKTVHMQNEEK